MNKSNITNLLRKFYVDILNRKITANYKSKISKNCRETIFAHTYYDATINIENVSDQIVGQIINANYD